MRHMGLDIEGIVVDVLQRRQRKGLRREVIRKTIDKGGATLRRINAELRAHGLSPSRTIEQAVRAANARPLPSLKWK